MPLPLSPQSSFSSSNKKTFSKRTKKPISKVNGNDNNGDIITMSNFVSHLHNVLLEPLKPFVEGERNGEGDERGEGGDERGEEEEDDECDFLSPILITQNVHELLSNGRSRHLIMDLIFIIEDMESLPEGQEIPSHTIKDLLKIIKKDNGPLFIGELRSSDLLERLLLCFTNNSNLSYDAECFILNFLYLSFHSYPKLISLYCSNRHFLFNLSLKYFLLSSECCQISLWLLHSLMVNGGITDLNNDWIISFGNCCCNVGFKNINDKDRLVLLQCIQIIISRNDVDFSTLNSFLILFLKEEYIYDFQNNSNDNDDNNDDDDDNMIKLKSIVLCLNILVDISVKVTDVSLNDMKELIVIFILIDDDLMSLLLCIIFINLAKRNCLLRKFIKKSDGLYQKVKEKMNNISDVWMYYGVLIGIIDIDCISLHNDNAMIDRIKNSFASFPTGEGEGDGDGERFGEFIDFYSKYL